jgi:hypothetical protein
MVLIADRRITGEEDADHGRIRRLHRDDAGAGGCPEELEGKRVIPGGHAGRIPFDRHAPAGVFRTADVDEEGAGLRASLGTETLRASRRRASAFTDVTESTSAAPNATVTW